MGGFPRKRASEIFGWEGSGKTTLGLSACAQAQRKGLYAAYLDVERGVDLSLAKRIGFNYEDETKGLYATPSSIEETMLINQKLVEAGVPIIVCDSIAAMIPRKELEGDIDDMGAIGLKSRILAQFLARITKMIYEYNTALVFCNQMRSKINTSWANRNDPSEQSSGGNALKFYTSLRLDIKKGSPIKVKRSDDEIIIGHVHHARAFKNKVAVPNRECEFFIKFDKENDVYGIDNLQTIIEVALEKHVIEAGGAGFYKYNNVETGSNFSARGKDDLYQTLVKNPAIYKEVRAKAGI